MIRHRANLPPAAGAVTLTAVHVPTSLLGNGGGDVTMTPVGRGDSVNNQTAWQSADCLQVIWNLTVEGAAVHCGGGTDFGGKANNSSSVSEEEGPSRMWVLLLLIFPVFTFFGNVLVVLSVYRERSLRTVTNYFIVSLAVADIMVGILVMPLGILQEVNSGIWKLGDDLCDTWVALDCCCCTASILNLTAISVDRFIAVTQPIKYAKHKNSNRVYLTLAMTWVVSIAISSPIALGVNKTERRKERPFECTFFNADFLIYSSMGSFYIPTVVMILLYWRIFAAIRQRAKRAAALRARGKKSPPSAPHPLTANNSCPGSGAAADPNNQQHQASCAIAAATKIAASATMSTGLDAGMPVATATGNTDAGGRAAFIQAAGQRTRPPETTPLGPGSGLATTTTSDTSCTEDGGATSTRELLPSSRHRASHSAIEEETSFTPYCHHQRQLSSSFKAKADVNGGVAVEGMGTQLTSPSTGCKERAVSTNKQSSVNTDAAASDYQPSHTSDDDAVCATVVSRNGGYRAPSKIEMENVAGATLTFNRASLRAPPASAARQQQQFLSLPSDKGDGSDSHSPAPIRQMGRGPGPRVSRILSAASATSAGSEMDGIGEEGGAVRKESGGKGRTVMRFNFYLPRGHRGGASKQNRSNKEKNAHRREKKATKTLAIVLGVFLFCWLPFFTINIINAICIRYALDHDPVKHPECQLDAMLFSFFVWLGYINSFLNPIIYTIFNIEFRRAFKKILQRPCSCKA